MNPEIYVSVYAYRFGSAFWSSNNDRQLALFDELNTFLEESRKDLINLRTYRSMRHDCDLIMWLSAYKPEQIASFREGVNRRLAGTAEAEFSMLSLYEHSPYIRAGDDLADSLRFPPLKYFVAYPMNKSPEWYLVDASERKNIMAEHIGMATSNPENKNIRSYTTYSYGISDQEFVVIYETDSIAQWSHVTAKLREAKQRKWVTKEYPIFVGILSEPFVF